nr:hypothetical protein [Tanacetum cinerariifolium]
MGSLSPQVVFAAKLPILNPNEFDLWKMRFEQYFLMTGYSFWEVILNGDSPVPTRVVDGVLQPVAPTTTKQRLARKNELKARGTLLMALPNKHQLKFDTHKDAKTLMEAIEKRFGGNTETKKEDINLKFLRSLPSEWRTHTLIWRNKTDLDEQSLDDLFNSLKIYEAEVKISSSASTTTQNIAFVSSYNTDSTNEPVSDVASVFVHIDVDALEDMDLKWQMAMLTVRARRFLQRTGRNLKANGPTSMGFDMSKVECYNYHRKGHFARECSYDWSFQAKEEPTNYALMVFLSLSSSSDNELSLRQNLEKAEQERDDLKLNDKSLPPSPIYDEYQSGNGYHVVPPPYIGTFMLPKPDLVFNNAPNDVETDHPAFNVKLSPTKPDANLSHTRRPSIPIIEDLVSDSDDESKTKTQNVPSFVQPTEQVKSPIHFVQHVKTSIPPKTAIPKPTSNGKCRNRKACFMCKSLDHLIKDCDYHEKKMAQPTARTHAQRGNHKHYARMSLPNPQRHVVPTAVLTQSKLIPLNIVRPVSTVVPKISVTRPRQAKNIVTKTNSPPRRHINRSPSPKASNSPPRVTTVKAPMGNPQHALKDKRVIDSGCSRHMTGNISYLSNFEELNGGYVAFSGNPKGGKILEKVLLRVPRENNMYNVNLKNIVPSRDLTCLFAKATLDESNLVRSGKGLLGLNDGSCGGKGGRGGSMVGRGGWLAKRSMVSNKGRGGSGLVVRGEDCLDGCDGAGGSEVNGEGAVLGVFKR